MLRFDAEIVAITPATPTIHTLRLSIPDPAFRFLPGQWVDFSVEIDGTPCTAGFSITNSPLERGGIELAIRTSGRHPVARWIHDAAHLGDRVRVSQGQGPFVYLPEMSENIVLIGGGVGVTPLVSIFRFARDAGLSTNVHLVYSVSAPEEILFHDELLAAARTHANLAVELTVTQPAPLWTGRSGRIDAARLQQIDAPPDTLYYLCGPRGMIEDMSTLLHDRMGIPMSRIIFEKWW